MTAELTGVTGVLASLIEAMGELGVGLLTLLETLVPPVPSEVILPLAGFLAQQGRLSLLGIALASTAGSVVGAWIFYALGARLGLERSIRWAARIPLVDRQDLERASDWFDAHGRGSVFFGRFVPGVRSLVSLPAGAQRMPLLPFTLATAGGSAIWNIALVAAGYLLGTQWQTVGRYVSLASNVVVAALALVLVVVLVRRFQRRRSTPRVP